MRPIRAIAILSLALPLLAGSTAAVAAVSERPSPWFESRVEMTEAGFAVTVPGGWVAMDPSGDLEHQRQVMSDRWGALYRDPNITNAFGDLYLLSGPDSVPGYESCDFTRVPVGSAAMLARYAEWERQQAADGNEVEREIQDVRTVDVPAGEATVVDWVEGDIFQMAIYLFEQDDRAVRLTCFAIRNRPEDDWLYLAQAFEFLPFE